MNHKVSANKITIERSTVFFGKCAVRWVHHHRDFIEVSCCLVFGYEFQHGITS